MKIIVPLKRALDYTLKPGFKAGGEIDISGMKMSINPFDEIALEEAIRLREQGVASEVIILTVGNLEDRDVLRHGLALGADRAMFGEYAGPLDTLGLAKILRHIILDINPGILLLGKQSIDSDSNQVGQMLAALLGWPLATFASKITVSNGLITVVQEMDHGLDTVFFEAPGVITADLRLNTPRFATLPNIMKARGKPIETLDVQSFGLDLSLRLKQLSVGEPPKRTPGKRVESALELITCLKEEGVWP